MVSRRTGFLLAAVSIPSLLIGAAPSFAQTAAPATVAGGATGVDEIVVTAQRREEKAIDVPLAVAAVSGTRLKSLGVQQGTDLVKVIPDLTFVDAGPIPKLAIRGISLNDFGDSNESPIAVYVDDVYIASPAAPLAQFFDVDHVDVLRGPQGTLFGRNAEGGLVQIVSTKPGSTYGGDLSLQLGSYGQVIATGGFNIPFSDQIRTRTAFIYNDDDGWQSDPITHTRYGSTNAVAVREIIDFDISPRWTNELSGNFSDSHNVDPALGFRGALNPTTGAVCAIGQVFANQCVNNVGMYDPNPNPHVVYSQVPKPLTVIQSEGVADTLHYHGDGFNISSITAYQVTDKNHEFDEGGSGNDTDGYTIYAANRAQFSQEVRLDGETGPLKWDVGGYYFNEALTNGFVTIPYLVPIIGTDGIQDEFNQTTNAIAGFGQIDYTIIPNVTLTSGLRYTDEDKKLNISNDFSNPLFVNHEVAKTDRLTWKEGANWRFTPGWLTYFSVATGYKSPAFDTSFVGAGGAAPSLPETDISYEVGVKGETPDHNIELTADAYYNDYTNFQLVGTPPGSVGYAAVTVLTNAKQATIYGLEADITAHPIENMLINVSADYLHTRINSPGLLFGGLPITGDPLALSPEYGIKGLISYDWKIPGIGTITPRLDGRYQSASYDSFPTAMDVEITPYTVLDAGVAWTSPDDRYKVELLVDNLLDTHYYTYTNFYLGVDVINWGKVRTGAIRFSTKF